MSDEAQAVKHFRPVLLHLSRRIHRRRRQSAADGLGISHGEKPVHLIDLQLYWVVLHDIPFVITRLVHLVQAKNIRLKKSKATISRLCLWLKKQQDQKTQTKYKSMW